MTIAVGTTGSTGTTGAISSAGIGSGLDVNSIISKLMAIEQAPLTQLQAKATSINTTISTYGAVQSAVSSFRDASLVLTNPSTWSANTATSSDASAITVSSSATAATGSYSIAIQSLAVAQSTVSPTFSSGAASVGSGTLHIDLGNWTAAAAPTPPATQGPPTFNAQSGTSGLDIAVTPGDTLTTLSAKINAAGAGVSASIITDTTGARLVLSSSTTGVANGFRVTTADADGTNTDASGLSALAFDPANGATATTSTQSAANATASINGLTVSSATNTLSNVLPGLTLNLLKASTSPLQVNVAQDTTSMKTSINAFVTAYNSLSSLLATDTKYDSSTATAGPLQGDNTAVSLQRMLRNILGSSSTASTAFSTLSQVGIQTQSDGTLKVNDATLTNAMANTSQMKALFATSHAANPSTSGFAQQFVDLTESALGIGGLLTSRVAGLNTSLTKNTNDQTSEQTLLTATEARLRAQYTALDTQMASITALSSYVTQQIATWNKNTG